MTESQPLPCPFPRWSVGTRGLGLLIVLWSGCVAPDFEADVTVRISDEVPTVAVVEWEIVHEDATGASVEFGPYQEYEFRAPGVVHADGLVRATLMGMKQHSTYHFRVVETVDEQALVGPDETLETGALLWSLPPLALDVHDELRAHQGFLVTSVLAQPSVAVIIDSDGEYVWAHQPEVAWDTLFIPRVALSHIGEWVVYHAAASALGDADDESVERVLIRVGLDGTDEELIPVRNAHHDFVELGDGSFAVLVRDRRLVEGELVEGDQIVEFLPDGSEIVVWSVWDYAEYDPDEEYGEAGSGWSHANALRYDKDEDVYYVSLCNFDSIVKIDRTRGRELWTLGGDQSHFTNGGGQTTFFRRQHHFEILDDGILVFDNRTTDERSSRVVEYRLDEDRGMAELVWEHENDPPCFALALGDVARLPSSDTLITWSSAGQIDQVTTGGLLRWRLRSDIGAGFGYTQYREVLYNLDVDQPNPPSPGGSAPDILGGQGGGKAVEEVGDPP